MEEIKKQKRPAGIGIIALLILLGGIWQIITGYTMLYIVLWFGLAQIITGVAAIVIAIGMDKMKMWALYAYTAVVATTILLSIIPELNFGIEEIISILILAYFWSNRKLFS